MHLTADKIVIAVGGCDSACEKRDKLRQIVGTLESEWSRDPESVSEVLTDLSALHFYDGPYLDSVGDKEKDDILRQLKEAVTYEDDAFIEEAYDILRYFKT